MTQASMPISATSRGGGCAAGCGLRRCLARRAVVLGSSGARPSRRRARRRGAVAARRLPPWRRAARRRPRGARRPRSLDAEVARPAPRTPPRATCCPGSSGAVSRAAAARLRLLRLDVDRRAAGGASRTAGTTPPFAARSRRAALRVDRLALLPVREHRRGDEDRRVGAGERRRSSSAKAKSLQRLAAEEQQREDRQQRAERRRQRPRQHLAHRAVDDLRERGARHARHVLAHAVEHDDRVVERVAQDRQQRRDRRRRHLPAGQRVDARRDQQVVHQRDQHRHRELPLEAQRDVAAEITISEAMIAMIALLATVLPNVGPIVWKL